VLGVAFAVTFIIFRVILWPFVSYYFWLDALELLRTKDQHTFSEVMIYIFLVFNAGLSLLQLVWLKEIFDTAGKVLFGGGDLSIGRGDNKPEVQVKVPAQAESKKSK
jgi:TLC domain